MDDDDRCAPPALLTVEEAAELIRVGRTKAYDMTREWRATGGQSGLPVVDFGNVLRVPRAALETLLGIDLSSVNVPRGQRTSTEISEPSSEPGPEPLAPSAPEHSPRARRKRALPTNQLDLFDPSAS